MRRLILLLVIGAPLAWAADPPQPITLADALRIMRQNSPTLASAHAHLAAVQTGEITAALRPNPTFSSANEDFRLFSPSRIDVANAQEFTDSLAWTVERGGKRRARVESARYTTTVAKDSFADIQRQLEFQVKSAFVSLLAAKAALQLAQDNNRSYQQTLQANQLRLQVGDISQTDFDRFKLQEAQFQSDLLNARLQLAQSRATLAALLGINDPSSIEGEGDLHANQLTATIEELRDRALSNRPDYLAARDSILKAQADTALAKANGAADVSVAPEYKRNGPDNTVGFTVQVPLRIFDRNQGEKLRTQHELEASKFSEIAARTQTLSDVSQAWEAYNAALARTQLYAGDYLQRARDVRDRVEFSYQHGAIPLLDYLDAIRSYRQVELDSINANAQLLTSIHQLSFVTATELLP